jgi:response regulator NasT
MRARRIVIDPDCSGDALLEQLAAVFPEVRRLREQLAEANLKLSERKLVERAKGLLMKVRGLDEDAAYRALRRMAMDKNRRIGEVARSIIETAQLLG